MRPSSLRVLLLILTLVFQSAAGGMAMASGAMSPGFAASGLSEPCRDASGDHRLPADSRHHHDCLSCVACALGAGIGTLAPAISWSVVLRDSAPVGYGAPSAPPALASRSLRAQQARALPRCA
jgi:hypothetical protein